MKPNIKILATGGTIAGTAKISTQTTNYTAGALGIDELLNAVPEIKNFANVTGEQICNIDSKDMTDEIWLTLANKINENFSRDEIDGIVVTHGTDTLEETAYFLNLTVHGDKPVVLTGAMRPATAISSDGSMNLLNAVRIAAHKNSFGKGVLVALNDEINSAREVTKTNTLTLSTFKSFEFGLLGSVNAGIPEFYRTSTRRHTINSEFDISGLKKLPLVKIIYGHAGDDGIFIDAAINAGVNGIIYAGTGNGSIHANAEEFLSRAANLGIVIVRSSRCGGSVTENQKFLSGDNLSPQKARILLQLALTKTNDRSEIQRMFNQY
ncbi:MAG: asparaginase [Selenomonadaceae bacterium]|nr:asparaginase [Selenomonadaceae bacterium]